MSWYDQIAQVAVGGQAVDALAASAAEPAAAALAVSWAEASGSEAAVAPASFEECAQAISGGGGGGCGSFFCSRTEVLSPARI